MVKTDSDGFLLHLGDWNEQVAIELAEKEGIELTAAHWEILWCLREFYQSFDLSPAMRPFIRYIKQNLDLEKANSVYLLTLFPGSPAKLAAKIAGLPRPENCL